jgi:Zn-dependent protease
MKPRMGSLRFSLATVLPGALTSFNPLKHIDLFGTILMPALLLLLRSPFLFGYAKPVPVNYKALRNPRRDMVWVSCGGRPMFPKVGMTGARSDSSSASPAAYP